MLAHVVSTSAPARMGAAFHPLQGLMGRVRLQMVHLNAKDVFSLCATINSGDKLGFMQDPEFMRGMSDSFHRSDQTVLTPFQISVVTDTFGKAGLIVQAKEVAIPDAEVLSPESLLNVLQSMQTTKQRDDRKMTEVCRLMGPLLAEFTPVQLASSCKLLSQLQCSDKNFMGRLGRRAVEIKDELGPMDISAIIMSLCYAQLPPTVLYPLLKVAEERVADLKADDVILILQGLNCVGPKYVSTLAAFADHALEDIERVDIAVLGAFVTCFVTLEYSNRGHVEIFVDAVTERADQLVERQLVMVMQAALKLNVLSAPVFRVLADRAVNYASVMDARNIYPVMDVCSAVAFDSAQLMQALMDRVADKFMFLPNAAVGDILDCLSTYPPAKTHRVVEALGKHTKRRMDGLGGTALAQAVKGLSMLGYMDPELYTAAANTYVRWGFKDYSLLEPILHGLCLGPVDAKLVPILCSHLVPMAKRMSLQEVERCNRYLTALNAQDDYVYRALAERVRLFVKDPNADLPQEIQALLARAAAAPARDAEGGHRRRRQHY
jgi:hypothetical protein